MGEIFAGVGLIVVVYAIWLGFKLIAKAIENSKLNKK